MIATTTTVAGRAIAELADHLEEEFLLRGGQLRHRPHQLLLSIHPGSGDDDVVVFFESMLVVVVVVVVVAGGAGGCRGSARQE